MGGLSLTSAMFIFQACYGTPQDFGYDILVEGKVTAKTTGLAIPGIKVVVGDNIQFTLTNEEGYFSFYTISDTQIPIRFQDIDRELNGSFGDKEIIVSAVEDRVYLNVDLQEE